MRLGVSLGVRRGRSSLAPLRALLRGLVAGAALACAAAHGAGSALPVYGYQVVNSYPHDAEAFTEGLFFRDGFLYESTGLKGRSSVRKVRLQTGEVISRIDLPDDIFGEGIAVWKDSLIGLTYQSQVGFVLDLKTFERTKLFNYPGEGWGLASDGRQLVMSDGTAELRFLDPATQRELRRLRVTADGAPVARLNELEWVKGEIFANVWETDRIARIDPGTGKVTGWIDLASLLPASERVAGRTDVLNGIAYDPAGDRLFVTGKFWPRLYEIRLLRRRGGG